MTAELLSGLEAEPGERVLLDIVPDRGVWIRHHLIIAIVLGLGAGIVLLAIGNPFPWVGPVAAALALAVRGVYLGPEVMAMRWQLTDRRLILPGGRAIRLSAIARTRVILGDVQIVDRNGDKHLIRNPADAPAILAAIDSARGQA